jgi:hypothetical protein
MKIDICLLSNGDFHGYVNLLEGMKISGDLMGMV